MPAMATRNITISVRSNVDSPLRPEHRQRRLPAATCLRHFRGRNPAGRRAYREERTVGLATPAGTKGSGELMFTSIRVCFPGHCVLESSRMAIEQRIKDEFNHDGFAIQEGLLSSEAVDSLIGVLERHEYGDSLERQGKVFAVRNLLDQPEIAELAGSSQIRALIEAALAGVLFPCEESSLTSCRPQIGRFRGIKT